MTGNEFLSVEASARVSDVVELLADAALRSVIVHDEDEDDFYVVPAGDVTSSAEGDAVTMGVLPKRTRTSTRLSGTRPSTLSVAA